MRRRFVVLIFLCCLGLVACSELASSATHGMRKVEPHVAKELIDQGATLIDVRTAREFADAHLAGAMNYDVQSATFSKIGELDKAKIYVVYCKSGNRSATAVVKMKELGFSNVVDAGGLAGLKAIGLPTIRS